MRTDLAHFPEPPLLFNHDQATLDPRDGLSLFGPLDQASKPEGIRWAVIGPKECINRMQRWVERIQKPVFSHNPVARPVFPGFEAAFNTRWNPTPSLRIEVPEEKLRSNAHYADKHQRVYRTVDMFAERIRTALRKEEAAVDLWCVVIPEYVFQNCRPLSTVAADVRVEPTRRLKPGYARSLSAQPSLFTDDNELAQEYLYEVNFHHQLKARLLRDRVVVQIVRESKIAFRDFVTSDGRLIYPLEKQESAIAWNLSTTAFYKAGGRPWKLGAGREGVCYVGLVFKQDEKSKDWRTACCAAQMFLDSGDGVVFKGAVGPWYRGRRGLFHLNRQSAKEIAEMCVQAYADRNAGRPPNQLFIHGQVALDEEEWNGFRSGTSKQTEVVGVRIRPVSAMKLFTLGTHAVPRGLAYYLNEHQAYLWTRGVVPRLKTYPGREVPNPLLVDVCRGNAELDVVLRDILALTKLNYNACNYADGIPVTLKFARAVGEILTAGPTKKLDVPPLPFKYYI